MSEEEQYNSVLQEIKGIFQFLTEGEPSPDDEIEAREKLLELFNELDRININGENQELIGRINTKLEQWDTLDLWFLETSIPEEMKKLFESPLDKLSPTKADAIDLSHDDAILETLSSDISVDHIVDKVSEQFKGEIDTLKSTIENLKKELDKKDQAIKSISQTQTKKVKKIVPKKDVKLPPPKIKIPVIKKPIPPHNIKAPATAPKPISDKDAGIVQKVNTSSTEAQPKGQLTPIPLKPVKPELEIPRPPVKQEPITLPSDQKEKPSLIPIPMEEEEISLDEIKLPEEKPAAVEKIKLTPIITEIDENDVSVKVDGQLKTSEGEDFSLEKPKITSVSIEEVETESIKSSGKDLFSVFSSVGEKSTETPFKVPEQPEPDIDLEKKKKSEKKKKKEDILPQTAPSTFVNLGGPQPEMKSESQFTVADIEDLPADKDSLYQELIALEGRRYSLEKTFKELERNYNKGSIADLQYKNQSDNLKKKLNDITSRINKIRRIISSL